MNLIFLDIDGVLTTKKTDFRFSKDCIDNLLGLTKKTRAGIVICSSWKEDTINKTLSLLPEQIRDLVIGQTPDIPGKKKGDEVRAFLRKHPALFADINDDYVILDDKPELYLPDQVSRHLVATNTDTGLTKEDVQKAVTILH